MLFGLRDLRLRTPLPRGRYAFGYVAGFMACAVLDSMHCLCGAEPVRITWWAMTMASYAACFLIALPFSFDCGVLFIGVHWACAIASGGQDGALCCLSFGLFAIFLHSRFAFCVMCWGVNVMFECAISMVSGGTARHMSMIAVCESFAALAGMLCRWYVAQACAERHESQVRQDVMRESFVRRDLDVASLLHDSLANDLSYISMVADDMSSGGQGAMRQQLQWARVKYRSRQAYRHSHDIVRMLRDACIPDTDDRQIDGIAMKRSVEQVLCSGMAELHGLGFRGTCDLSDEGQPQTVDAGVDVEIRSLVGELFANIRKHCDREHDEYSFHVILAEHSIRIVQMNTTSGDTPDGTVIGGQGLAMHRFRVESCGGTFRYNVEHGIWTLYAEIPYIAHDGVER